MSINEIKTLQEKANMGDVDAQRSLGMAYMFGDYGEVDYANAWRYYSMAAKQKDAYSTFSCGYMLFYGYGVEENRGKAIELWTMAAEYGSGDAMEKLAICYEDGIGVPANADKAKALWQKAMGLGMPNALFNGAADIHNRGLDAAKKGNWDEFVSLRWTARLLLEKAVKAGSKNAQELLWNGYGGYILDKDKMYELDKAAWNQIRGL